MPYSCTGKLADDPVQAVEMLAQVQQLTEHCDAPDQARAKLFKANAYAYAMAAVLDQDGGNELLTGVADYRRPRRPRKLMERALALFPGVGGQAKVMDRLRARIVKAVPG